MFKRFGLYLIVVLLLAACGTAATPASEPTTAPTQASVPTSVPTIAAPILAATLAPSVTPSAFPLTISDSAGRKVTLNKAPQRIVSLAPSNTEMLFALEQGSKLVAVDDLSDFPAEAKALPKIGSFKINFEQLVAQNPDLVLAAGITDAESIKKLEDLKLTVAVISSKQTTMESVMSDIALVGKMVGASDKAKQLTDAMQQKLDALKAKAASAKTKPKVYWELDATDLSKPYTVGPGNFVNDIITLGGGVNAFASASAPYAQVGSEAVVGANPDVIILSDAAYGISPESVKARKGWETIAAVKNNKVFAIDDNLVSRPGPRVVEGLEAAMKLMHPELFQ